MSTPTPVRDLFALDNDFASTLPGLAVPWSGAIAPNPQALVVNDALASELGLDPDALRSVDGLAVLSGSVPPADATPVAMAYSGHQFGNYSPQLGDGRALLLGELVTSDGRRDVHLKGSGRTPFSRGGDGKAVVGPMLREYLISEAMHALGIPTTRSLAVVATGDTAMREQPMPAAVLTRIAASHLRVGMCEFAVRQGIMGHLADYAIARHYPHLLELGRPQRYTAFLTEVIDRQAALVAHWMSVGFVHGVLNTDNTTLSGETIDYGPCAFVDAHNLSAVFSSIDTMGRYAYGNQPAVIGWNMARLAETLIPLVADRGDDAPDTDAAIAELTDVVSTFTDRYEHHHAARTAFKLGLVDDPTAAPSLHDAQLLVDLDSLLSDTAVDHTGFFRGLADNLDSDAMSDPSTQAWVQRWVAECDGKVAAQTLRSRNPAVIPRNHLVDKALDSANDGDLTAFAALLEAVIAPFDEPDDPRYTQPAPAGFNDQFQTFCGT